MAKAASQAVTTKEAGAVPAHIKSYAGLDTSGGRGVSTDASDNLVPLIYVLQSNSPQVDANSAQYLEGAKGGSIWLRNLASPLVDGSEGIVFQPCFFYKEWVEWRQRQNGGGFVGRHGWNDKTASDADGPGRPPEAKKVPHPEHKDKEIWVMPSGNEVIETRYHVGFVITDTGPVPYVIPLKSTGHTFSKNWMFSMNQERLDGKPLDSWLSYWRLTTRQRSNSAGKWYMFEAKKEGWAPTADDVDRGQKLFEAFVSGQKVAAGEEEIADAAPAATDAM